MFVLSRKSTGGREIPSHPLHHRLGRRCTNFQITRVFLYINAFKRSCSLANLCLWRKDLGLYSLSITASFNLFWSKRTLLVNNSHLRYMSILDQRSINHSSIFYYFDSDEATQGWNFVFRTELRVRLWDRVVMKSTYQIVVTHHLRHLPTLTCMRMQTVQGLGWLIIKGNFKLYRCVYIKMMSGVKVNGGKKTEGRTKLENRQKPK